MACLAVASLVLLSGCIKDLEPPQPILTASDGAPDDWFGSSLDVSGSRALVGAFGRSEGTGVAEVIDLARPMRRAR